MIDGTACEPSFTQLLRLCFFDPVGVFASPVAEWPEGVEQGNAEGCQRVLDSGRDLLKVVPGHDPVVGHFAELLDQHLLADARYQPPELAEPVRAGRQMPEHDRLPFATDNRERRPRGPQP